jgi:lipopolysaccharide/colanic/teichoic acid biosynthesis glycosyltransferase
MRPLMMPARKRGVPLHTWSTSAGIKRSLDVIGASTGLILTAPLLLAAAVAIRLTMGSPVVFRQVRPGLRGSLFTLNKLRTMTPPPSDGDPQSEYARVTTLGRWLRRTSIDELPQLWNVVRGDMSLVGPRPLLVEYLERYDDTQARRHDVRPGITGWAQVHRRTALEWEEKLELDVWYVDHWSLRLDVRIFARTLKELLVIGGGDPSMDSLSRTASRELEFRGSGGAAYRH